MNTRNFAPILETKKEGVSSKQVGTFARHTSPCKPPLEKMNPHPSETTPRVPCHQYYPSYCKPRRKKVCVLPESSRVMVHLAENGDIQKAALTKSQHVIRKDYTWSKISPLQPPLSNNIPDCIPEYAWDPNCRELYQGS